MRHPELFLVPVLMLADYYLTLVGFLLYRKGYRNHVKIEQYELNPVWQSSIAKMRWLNPRHLLITALVTGAIYLFLEVCEAPDETAAFLLGICVMSSVVVVGRHLAGLMIFRHAMRHPDQFSGSVQIGYEMTVRTSQYQILATGLPLVVVALLAPSPFVIGGTLSVLFLGLIHGVWLRRYRKKRAKEEAIQAEAAEGEQPPDPDS